MKTPLLSDRLTRVSQRLTDKLDTLSARIPTPAQDAMPFEHYIKQARTVAAANPEFAQELERAWAQYKTLGRL